MKCPRCQHDNPPQAKFCLECATPLALRCTNCGTQLPAGAKFCFECATPVSAASSAPRFASPETYTPKHLAERIINSKAALEGERKQVTVLFADLKGSMELLADRDPEEARKLLDPVLEHMMEAVHRYEGTVNQVMGDGIMALFGAPVAHEDHAVRACYASLRIQDTVKRYAERLQGEGRPVQVRVGLNSGEVVVRSIGSDLRMDYTAVGATTHLAARMEQLAASGSILMTATTYALAEGYVQVHARGPTTVKGLADPVAIYELTGASGLRTRFQTSLSRGLSRFVGRGTALVELRSALVRAAGGHGQVVAMLGEPGVGKSRLLYEFVNGTDTRDWLILEGRAFSYAQATPYLPLIDVLKAYFQIQERDDATKIGDKVAGKLVLDEAAGTLLSPILALLDVPVDDAGWRALDPRERRQRTLDACRHLLVRESRLQPMLVILEDLHWVDSETQAFLDALVETLAGAPILLLVNYRPEYRHNWGSKTYYRQVQLEPLPREDAEALLVPLLGSNPSLAPLTALLVEQTEGNPLFLEECVRSLVESKTLVGERGTYRLVADASRLRVPATVHAILAARIDRLAPADKALLQAAAVIGKEIPWTVLRAIAGAGELELREGLARLQRAEFIVEGQLFPDLEFTFRHALTHDVAYESLLQERRRLLHGQVLDEMERLYQHRLMEHVEALGYHATRGERWDKAVTYLRLAADKARARSAHVQAVAHVQQAIRVLDHVPLSRTRDIDAIELRLELRQSYYVLGDLVRSRAILEEAELLAETAGAIATEQLGWVVLYIGENFRLAGDLVRACEYYERAKTLAAADNVSLRTGALHYLGIAFHGAGRYTESVDLFRSVEAEPRAFEGRRLTSGSAEAARVVNTSWLVRSLALLGHFQQAIDEAEAGLASAERVGSAYGIVLAMLALGEVHRERGDWTRAITLLERSVARAEEGGFGLLSPSIASRLGAAYAHGGRFDDGLRLLHAAAASVRAQSENTRFSAICRLLGEACLLGGDMEEARGHAATALDVARTLHQRGDEAAAGWLLGVTTSGPLEAHGFLAEALALGSELGMRPLVAHCHLGLGKLYHRTDKREQAREHLATATRMYRDMGMRYWLKKVEAKTAELG